ncbi:hypothetical protein [Vagococcus sp.]|uniref:hypothetical protein n=1 Tax=Vagococcus sp. TaxID=1933889 RepID=UPI003F995EF3
MNPSLIFKSEIFKYYKDKPYMVTTLILTCLNLFFALFFKFYLSRDLITEESFLFVGLMTMFGVICLFANLFFLIYYPFHLLAMDYRNNVLALLVASGVNRRQLFFSKIGAALVWSLGVGLCLMFAPILILLSEFVKYPEFFEVIKEFYRLPLEKTSIFLIVILTMIIGQIYSLVLVFFATIVTKGSTLAILLYFGLSWVGSMVSYLILLVTLNLDFSELGINLLNLLIASLLTVIFGVLALKTMEKQNF